MPDDLEMTSPMTAASLRALPYDDVYLDQISSDDDEEEDEEEEIDENVNISLKPLMSPRKRPKVSL